MVQVFYIHWQEKEAKQRGRLLRASGRRIRVHWRVDVPPALREPLPDVLVISLDRLPSHGRRIAAWLWEAKKRQHIAIVFEGGSPEKVAATRETFPRAVYVPTGGVAMALKRIAAYHGT